MNSHILVVDCGSTGIRSVLLDKTGKVSHRYYKKINVYHPEQGATENDPEQIWTTFKDVVHKGIHTPFVKVEAIAITNQRSTFALWDKDTGKPITNFINWQDVRAADTVRKMNRNPIWRSLRFVSFFIGRLLRNPLLTVTSMLVLSTDHTICKLRWLLDNHKLLETKSRNNSLLFGTIDTWLLYNLTGRTVHG
ncbi:MAG: glycerol kinase, partial [Spirochaetales bacterium]|nr:glycerol kinase [Spirochaetales bacterium]